MDSRTEQDRQVPAVWQEPVRGGHPDPADIRLTGLEQLQSMLAGDAPEPPLTHLVGLSLTAVQPGKASFTMPLSGWLGDETGAIGPGPLTIPVDAAMACAAISLLGPQTGLTTSELGLRQVRPGRVGETVRADGQIIDSGAELALAEATLTGEDGRLIAHSTSLCIPLAMGAAPAPVPPASTPQAPAWSTPDPFRRPLPGRLAIRSTPIGVLTGLHAISVTPESATLALPATRWLCAPPPGRVQGGAVATLADAAMTAVIRAAAPDGVVYRPIEITVHLLRPLASDGRLARARARLVQAGRHMAVAAAEIVDANGRLVALAAGSALRDQAGGPGAAAWTAQRLATALATVIVAAGLGACGTSARRVGTIQRTASPIARLGPGPPARIAIVMMENEEYGDIIGSPQTPYLNRLARRYALAQQMYATTHPSLPNYLALTGGSTFGIDSDCTSCTVPASGLAAELTAAHVSWRAYMEDLPRPCFTGASSGEYARKHDPFVYYRPLTGCEDIVGFARLKADERDGSMPRFSWITPNLCHDMHDCSPSVGDRFLSSLVPPLLRALGRRGLLIITWDEGTTDDGCCRLAAGGHIATILAGPDARRAGRLNTPVDQYSILQTVEDLLGVRRLRGAACACTPTLDALVSGG